jgi:hypothetical protein
VDYLQQPKGKSILVRVVVIKPKWVSSFKVC